MIGGESHHQDDVSTRVGHGIPAERLFPLVYKELRAIADRWFRDLPKPYTLQPTAVVHEAFLRLAAQDGGKWRDSAHFKAIAAKAMRQVLADYGRRRQTAKRGANFRRVSLCEADTPPPSSSWEVSAAMLDELLEELARLNERQATIVEMRFLGGLTVGEVAGVLGVSSRTVELDWKMARSWLLAKLRDGSETE